MGLLGVTAFSFTVPFTRIVVSDGAMTPLFVGSGRAVIAACLAGLVLRITRQRLPVGRQWVRIAVVAGGVVVGFPLLTSYALTTVPASHGAVVIAILPAVTAVMAVVRTGERPTRTFWVASAAGAVAAVVFAGLGGGSLSLQWADLLLFVAVVVCAIGYAEGGLLSRELGSWQTISWALVLVSPLMVALTAAAITVQAPSGGVVEWSAFAYLGAVSMFLGFVAWYRGLAIGPMAQVSQVQLVQPIMSIVWAGLLLGEHIGWETVVGGTAVLGCALFAVRARSGLTTGRAGRRIRSVRVRRPDSGGRTLSSTGSRSRCTR